MDNNFSFPVAFEKSGNEKNGRIPITIVPNQPTVDRVNDKILLSAFDDDCMKSFIFDGVLDWDHMSILGTTPLERSEAIVGQPERMYVDSNKKVPIIEGFLFAKNPYVMKSIYPALEAGSDRLGASLGGKILLKSMEDDPETHRKVNTISKIRLKHCAISPLQKCIHQGTSISLRKSGECDDFDIDFPSFGTFMKSIENYDDFMKTLQAGTATNITEMSGGQSLQNQDLEGSEKRKKSKEKMKKIMPTILKSILNGEIGRNYEQYMAFLKNNGLDETESDELIKLIALKAPGIVKLTF